MPFKAFFNVPASLPASAFTSPLPPSFKVSWGWGLNPRPSPYHGDALPAELPQRERAMGIEPTYQAWKASVLPLNYARIHHLAKFAGGNRPLFQRPLAGAVVASEPTYQAWKASVLPLNYARESDNYIYLCLPSQFEKEAPAIPSCLRNCRRTSLKFARSMLLYNTITCVGAVVCSHDGVRQTAKKRRFYKF